MKVIVFLALVAFSQAAHLFYYAGTTNSTTGGTSPQANYAIVDSNGACTAGTVASGYQMFTINSTINPGPTFYWITALFQSGTVDSAQVQVYNGRFSPATPCANLTFVASSTDRAPHSSVLVYLTPGFHDVVVTTTNPASAGVFSVHADRAMWNATTTDASPYMYIQNSGSSSCSSSSAVGTYTYYTWTAATTTVLDIVLFSYNSTIITNQFVATLYNRSNLAGIGTGNSTNPVDLCATGAEAFFVQTVYYETSINKISQNYFASATFTAVPVTAGTNYTVVFSTYDSQGDNYIYGIWTRPSLLGALGAQQNFLRPSFGSLQEGDICVNGTSGYYWYPIVFTAQYTTYVVDNGRSPTNDFDTAACLYNGNNVGSADMLVAPVPCSANWLQCVDTGDVGPLHQLGTTPGRNYTIVQTAYSTSYTGNYMLWLYTGVQLGPLPPAATTGVETGLMGSSSSASMIVASIALTFAAFFF